MVEGYIFRDPTERVTKTGKRYAMFSIPISCGKNQEGKPRTEWCSVKVYGNGYYWAMELKQGDRVQVAGYPDVFLGRGREGGSKIVFGMVGFEILKEDSRVLKEYWKAGKSEMPEYEEIPGITVSS